MPPRSRLASLAPLLVAAVLGFGGSGRWTLWQDEAFTWMLVQRDLAGVIDGAAQDRHPPLYYLLVDLFTPLGDRDWILRLPSVLGYVLAVGLLTRVPRYGGVAAWVVALSPMALLFAHTARMYAVLLGASTAMLVAGLALAQGEKAWRGAVGMALAAAVAIWTHYVGLAAVAAAGLGTALAILVGAPDRKGARLGMLVGAMAVAGLSFLPWALGPLQFQLGAKDVPTDRTWTVLAYLLWTFDSRVPPLSYLLVGLQLAGLVIVVRRRDPLAAMLWAQAAGALVLPYLFSRSGPAQNPRNYLEFLPAAALLIAIAAEKLGRGSARVAVVAPAAIALFAAEPLWDLWRRPVSPQEPGSGFDYQVEADVLDASAPKNGGLFFRPTYMVQQYWRYAPDIPPRTKRKVDSHAWLAVSRGEWVDSAVAARYTQQCTFRLAFRFVLYAEKGPGCDALDVWLREVAAAEGYVPFLQELAWRALASGDLDRAEGYARTASKSLDYHPAAWILLAETLIRKGDGAGALAAADQALAITRTWHMGGGAMAQAHGLRAQALGMLGRGDDAKAATAAASCARRHTLPTACGAWWESYVDWLPQEPPPPAVLPPLPALSESQKAEVPETPPTGGERLALWAFDGEVLPEGWLDAGGSAAEPSAVAAEAEGASSLVLTTTAERPVALACGPLVASPERVALRLRWRYELGGGGGRTVARVEARLADAAGNVQKVNGVPVTELPLQTAASTSWRVDRFDFRPAPGTAQLRMCVKLEGTEPARFALDWLEVAGVGG